MQSVGIQQSSDNAGSEHFPATLPPAGGRPSSSRASTSRQAQQQQRGFSTSSSQLYQQPQSQLEQLPFRQSLQWQHRQGLEQHIQSPFHQAYGQFPSQVAPQKSGFGTQSQQQGNMGVAAPPSGRNEDMLQRNLKRQDIISNQVANQAQASTSKMFGHHSAQGDQQMELRQRVVSGQRSQFNGQSQPVAIGQSMVVNASRPIHAPQDWPSTQNIGIDQLAAMSKQEVISHLPVTESSANRKALSDICGRSGSAHNRQIVPCVTSPTTENNVMISANDTNDTQIQQLAVHGWESQAPLESFVKPNQLMDHSLHPACTYNGPETSQVQLLTELQQLNPPPKSAVLSDDTGLGTCIQSQGGQVAQMALQHRGFTEQQLNVLKAQIFAFHDLKKKGHVSQELLRAIAPPPLESQVLQLLLSCPVASSKGPCLSEEVSFIGNEETTSSSVRAQKGTSKMKEPIRMGSFGKEEQRTILFSVNSEQEVEHQALPSESDFTLDKGKAIIPQNAVLDAIQVRKSAQASTLPQPIDLGASREYGGPIFDIPFFSQNIGSSSSSISVSSPSNVALAYDVKDLLFVEGREVLNWKRTENFKKIGNLLATNLDKKWIRPDLVLKLKIQEKKLRLLECQAHLRNEVDRQQLEIMAMSDRSYRKFVQLCEHQRLELARQVLLSQRVMREKHLKSFFQWRKKLFDAHWAIRDARIARNKGVAKYHERMLKDFSRRKDEDRNKRIEALKNNDVDRYREMLLEQQTSISGDAAKRYAILSAFLTETEEYLYKLGEKIVASKNQQEVEEAAYAAAADARLQGLSEQEIRAATACAREELMIRTRFFEMTAPKKSSYNSKYYDLAHAVNETVVKQPSMLRGGTLRNYQLVGLQWMLSLYNNKLNGVLADEMGLGKTVQVMALIAYLMELKRNYGPHLIIVPNAVLVNWKSEFQNWLPSVSCIFYVGEKDQRSKLFSRDVIAMKFNVLVTTYEFVMHDRQKLSRIDWKYIIIDEAQRMKDRESVLARHLDRYHCQRRLLLTGTPLQNDLKELWSLLNLLLPEIFDNRKFFHDWFSRPFRKDGPTHTAEDDWLETETKVIIINRLHQILEPFMLRRRVEDVEGSLPPKVSVVLRCRMSALQGAIYDWIKSTGTLRLDPEDEMTKVQRNPIYQEKTCKALSNKCMELRKVCNHPLLNYPNFRDFSKDFVVRSCGKLWILDRILNKLKRTGHKVLLFSTMTKLLDILEKYLEWRQLVYKRIDGTTTLEDRESAIFHFNRPNSDCFIFLLSIRAAGRGLNLQSADTVVIYDPDPNPKNEEQAVARAHRIGQNREVKVIYMESVVDRISSHDKEDELRNGGSADLEHEISGTDRYMGSIESLIRSNIQQYKIEMADEVINAGRFDQTTTQEERRLTLEALLHDGERYQEIVHNVPSLQEVNRMIARSEEEVKLFDQMDEELDWTAEMTRHDQVPKWLRANSEEVNTTMAKFSKKSSRNTSLACYIGLEASEMVSDLSVKTENKRVQPKRSSRGKSTCIYREFDDENWDFYEASSQERSGYSMHEENGQTEEFEVEKSNGIVSAPSNNRKKLEEDDPICIGSCECPQELEGTRSHLISKEAGSSGSSPASQRLVRTMFPCIPSQKFGSLSSLDATSNSDSKGLPYELQEGENAVSGECHMDSQNFGSWFHDHIDGKDEQVSQPKIKRKCSIWGQPAHTVERVGKNIIHGKPYIHCAETGDGAEDHKNKAQLSTKENFASIRVATSKLNVSPKPSSSNCMSAETGDGAEDATEHSLESWDVESLNISRPALFGMKMSDITQRKCKNVISKIERKIDKAGHQLVPLLADLWKRSENSFYMINMGGSHLLNFRKIYQRLDGKDYDGVIDFVADVQSMLDGIGEQFGFSSEVKSEIRKVHGMFSDIMKSTFPATDFHEARNVLPYPSPGSTSTQAPRQASVGQSKRQKLIKETEPKPSRPTQLLQHGLLSTNENAETQKESQLVSSSSSR